MTFVYMSLLVATYELFEMLKNYWIIIYFFAEKQYHNVLPWSLFKLNRLHSTFIFENGIKKEAQNLIYNLS